MTVCVLGAPRGGTSAIAGLVRNLGIPFGPDIDEASNEDRQFLSHRGDRSIFREEKTESRRSEYLAHATSLIRARNDSNSVWGWKDPLSAEYVEDICSELRNPHFILVFRDVAAIAQRESLVESSSSGGKFLAYILNAQSLYSQAVEFVARHGFPAIAVSYERFLRRPAEGGRSVAEFLGFNTQDASSIARFAETYIRADKLTADLKLVGSQSDTVSEQRINSTLPDGIFATLRLDRGVESGNPEKAKTIGDRAYIEAAQALNAKKLPEAREKIKFVFEVFVDQYPALARGSAEILSHLMFFIKDRSSDLPYPDQVCGAFFMAGLSDFLLGRVDQAFRNFTIADFAIRNRLWARESNSEVSICRSLYWVNLLHLAKSASEVGRQDIVQSSYVRFSDARKWSDQTMEKYGGWENYDENFGRIKSEVSVETGP